MLLFCDAMLGGLSRWLRAAGYDARYEYGIDDADLLVSAERESGVVLSSDAPLFDRAVIKSGRVRALFVPRHRPVMEQAAFVLRELELPIREARCMRCGGELFAVDKSAVIAEVPPKTRVSCEEFWRCARCGKLYWHGAHWRKIEAKLAELREAIGG